MMRFPQKCTEKHGDLFLAANILSIALVGNKCRLIYDSSLFSTKNCDLKCSIWRMPLVRIAVRRGKIFCRASKRILTVTTVTLRCLNSDRQ